MMQYDIEWAKGLCESDLILCNVLTFCRIYHYNPRYDDLSKCVVLEQAEANGITRITVKLKTRDMKSFTMPPYYIADDEAIRFKECWIDYFTRYYSNDTDESR